VKYFKMRMRVAGHDGGGEFLIGNSRHSVEIEIRHQTSSLVKLTIIAIRLSPFKQTSMMGSQSIDHSK